MSIKRLFDATWDQVYCGAVAYGDSDIIHEQRVIIINRNVKKLVWGQLIMMFDEDERMALITSRFCVPQLAIPGYLHTLGNAGSLKRAGIVVNVSFERGLVTCTYSRIGWLEHVVQQSCASASSPEQWTQQPPTP